MKWLPDYVDDYAVAHTQVGGAELLHALERKTHLEVMRPQMLSGYLQGQFLALMSRLQQPRRILEVGTYTGYSALCLAQGLPIDGMLHTIDSNPELEAVATEFLQQAPQASQIIQHQGNALEIIPVLEETWDLVFLDADKVNYAAYYDLIFPRLKIGGLLIADNVLWQGKVAAGSHEKRASALAGFNKMVSEDSRVNNVLLPLRDGLLMIEKVEEK
ncbi:MAG: O-methyltransferase [Aureispira sp.]